MTLVTPSMGLRRWDDPNDTFSYVELSDNWALLDAHDHAPGKGVQIPTAGIANLAVDGTKVASDAITPSKILVNSITGDRLLNADVGDTKLASPNNPVWKTLFQTQGRLPAASAAATYVFAADELVGSGVSVPFVHPLFSWDDAHYLVAGKTIKFRLLGVVATNTVAPVATFSLGLHPVSSGAGSSNNLSITTGAVIAGSPVSVATPIASSRNTLTGTEFAPPADGVYVLAITTTGTTAANSLTGFNAMLQIRHV